MLKIDAASILTAQGFVAGASTAFGDAGRVALGRLFDSVRAIFASRPPEFIGAVFSVVVPVDQPSLDVMMAPHGSMVFAADAAGVGAVLADNEPAHAVVIVVADMTFRVLLLPNQIDPTAIAAHAVVYHRKDAVERILAGTDDSPVPRLSNIGVSNFAEPTLSGLDEALDRYAQLALESTCLVLARVWEGGVNGPRLVLVNKPEHVMRDSLFDTLSKSLRRAHIVREHMTDATRPVDLHVSWTGSPAEAIIEIKWLGHAMKEAGKKGLTTYRASRAQEGADQLADYLDRKKSSGVEDMRSGYLVVFDARRRNVKDASTPVSRVDGLAFERETLTYSPDHSATRGDFAPPRRLFLRPRESALLAA